MGGGVVTDRLAEALTAVRRTEAERITAGMLEEGFVGITGEALVGKTLLTRRVAAWLTHQQMARVVEVDLVGVYSLPKLVARWRHAVFRAAVGHVAASQVAALDREFWSSTTERAMLTAREMFGDELEPALTEQPRKGERPRDLAGAIELITRLARNQGNPCVLVLDHLQAPLLTYRHPINPRDVLWQIRAAAQHIPNLHVAVVCQLGTEGLAADSKAAFYGDGTWLKIAAPTPSHWSQAALDVGTVIDPAWVTLARQHVPTVLAMLHAREAGIQDLREAFRTVADSQHEHAARCLLHASSLHRLGAHVLASIANGDGPYAGAPEARSDDIAAAVGQLRLAGMIRRAPDDDRGWILVDPTIQWLLADAMNVRPEEPLPAF
jgi:hypothetical protein